LPSDSNTIGGTMSSSSIISFLFISLLLFSCSQTQVKEKVKIIEEKKYDVLESEFNKNEWVNKTGFWTQTKKKRKTTVFVSNSKVHNTKKIAKKECLHQGRLKLSKFLNEKYKPNKNDYVFQNLTFVKSTKTACEKRLYKSKSGQKYKAFTCYCTNVADNKSITKLIKKAN